MKIVLGIYTFSTTCEQCSNIVEFNFLRLVVIFNYNIICLVMTDRIIKVLTYKMSLSKVN